MITVAAAMLVTAMLPTAALASTPTVTTLDVPTGTQYGAFMVTAHVTPPTQYDGRSPVVEFHVDGVWYDQGPMWTNGDAEAQLNQAGRPLTPGTHEIVAKIGAYPGWDASESAPSSVRVGVATQVALSSSLNPAEDSQSVTVDASVTPSSISGGTLSIVDEFDGSTIASSAVGPSSTSVSVTRTFAAGSHSLTASYSGSGDFGPSETQLSQSVRGDSTVDATRLGVNYGTFYPYRDGYRDTDTIRGTLGEPARVLIRIYSPSGGSPIKTIDLGSRSPGRYDVDWTGRSSSGSIRAEGTYRVTQRLTDTAGNVRTVSHSVVLSKKRVIWHSATITQKGSQYDKAVDTGSGSIASGRSEYPGGVRLSSGTRGVAVIYTFTPHSALAYGDVITFEVLGKSPNGKRVAEGLRDTVPCSLTDIECYDTKSIGPGYRWWSIGGGPENISVGKVYGAVIVPYGGAVRIFDVSRVRLVYRWAGLGY